MNGCVRRLLMLFVLACSLEASAQNISVASFKLLANDLTANTTGTMERDQNGEIAALIKVVTSEQGFVFDGGMTGIVKTKQEIGEVWVYVPHGIKKMTIKHPQLGVLRDYYFPSTIDKAKTYEMVLATGKVETIVTHSVNKQFVVFNVKPVNAIVELDDEMLTVDSEGYATKSVTYGKYNYRVSCANYHTEAGQVTVNAQGKAEVSVTLRPKFGWIRFEGAEELHGAHVYIDNERVGQLPLTTKDLKSGVHQIRIVKELYKVYEQQITVSDNETIIHEVKMKPNFAKVTLIVADGGEIWIDGQKKAVTQWTGALEKGDYTVEVKKASHRSSSEVVHITELDTRTIQLKAPTPIYGSLEITSTPANATIILDGKNVGKTPMLLNDILVGIHNMVLEKDGYERMSQTIKLNEEPNQISLLLNRLGKIEDAIEYYQEGNYAEAIKIFRQLAEEDNAEALYYLGLCFDDALGVSEDNKLAVEYYLKAAERGLAKAQNTLGYCWNFGEGVDEVNYEKAVEWYRKAAEQGFPKAQINLGRCYIYGEGVPIDHRKAVEWYRKAAAQNHPTAFYSLALCYYNGEGVSKDLNEAKRLCLIALEKKVDGAEELLEEINKKGETFEDVDPEFPGGTSGLMSFLQENVVYPQEAYNANIQGRVLVEFIVNADGSISEPRIVKTVNKLLDTEALRVVGIMPKWKPGRRGGKNIRVKYTLPITFKLPN